MTDTHTPGPWEDRGDGVVTSPPNVNGYPQPIKIISPWIEGAWDGDSEALANARLIAAAPDLLGVCQRLEAHLRTGGIPASDGDEIRAQMQAAIAKAAAASSVGKSGTDLNQTTDSKDSFFSVAVEVCL